MSLLTVRETAEHLHRSYHTVLRMIHEKTLTAIMLPGSREYLVDPADLKALIDASKIGAEVGAIATSDDPKRLETMAPENRRQARNETPSRVGKYQWMQEYEPKRKRK